jgi:cytochrome c biogenesis protein CcmG/thiol:disulfide interchange protein DsbE
MGPRESIVAGLVAGLVAAVLFFAALVALAPETGGPLTPPPSLEPSPSPSAPAPSPDGSGPSPSPSGAGSSLAAEFMIGQPAPPLQVAQLGGGTIDLASLQGKPVWVEFMATWCPSCREELPRMADLAARYQDTGLVILVIDVREDESTVGSFMSSLGLDLPVGLDTDGSALAAWRGLALPVHYWVDATGTIRAGAVGALPPDEMAADLGTILPGVDVTS